jgi:hypothetical protein
MKKKAKSEREFEVKNPAILPDTILSVKNRKKK